MVFSSLLRVKGVDVLPARSLATMVVMMAILPSPNALKWLSDSWMAGGLAGLKFGSVKVTLWVEPRLLFFKTIVTWYRTSTSFDAVASPDKFRKPFALMAAVLPTVGAVEVVEGLSTPSIVLTSSVGAVTPSRSVMTGLVTSFTVRVRSCWLDRSSPVSTVPRTSAVAVKVTW